MDRRPVMQDLINENIIFEFADVVENGWAIVPKSSGLELGWYAAESRSLWNAAGFVGPYEEMVLYAMILTVKNNLNPDSFWTYCLAELGNSKDYIFPCWTPVAWNYKWELTEEAFERFYNLRKWTPQHDGFYINPLRRKWVRVGVGSEDQLATHEPVADSNIVPFVTRTLPYSEIVKRNNERAEQWADVWSAVWEDDGI